MQAKRTIFLLQQIFLSRISSKRKSLLPANTVCKIILFFLLKRKKVVKYEAPQAGEGGKVTPSAVPKAQKKTRQKMAW